MIWTRSGTHLLHADEHTNNVKSYMHTPQNAPSIKCILSTHTEQEVELCG